MKKLLLTLVLVAAVLAGGAVLWEKWAGPGAELPGREAYHFLQARRGRIRESVSATGLVQPRQVAVVTSELSGRVVEILPGADFNKEVKAGQELLRLDDQLSRGRLEQANAAVAMADADDSRARALISAAQLKLDKYRELRRMDVGLQKDVDQSEQELKAAQATLEVAAARQREAAAARRLAQLGVDMTTLRAPVSGLIIDRKVVVGQGLSGVQPTPLFFIASDLQQVQVQVQVPENEVAKVRPGMTATFSVIDYTNPALVEGGQAMRFTGTVAEVRLMPNMVQAAAFYPAVVNVENRRLPSNDGWFLRPGMSVYVDLVRREHTDVWMVPTETLDVKFDDALMTPAVRQKLQHWQTRLVAEGAQDDWRYAWILDAANHPQPVFFRIAGGSDKGRRGIKGTASIQGDDLGGEYLEVLEWEEGFRPDDASGMLDLIIEAPHVARRGWFEPPRMPKFF